MHNPLGDDHCCTSTCLRDEGRSTSGGQSDEGPSKGRITPATITAVATLVTALAALITAFR